MHTFTPTITLLTFPPRPPLSSAPLSILHTPAFSLPDFRARLLARLARLGAPAADVDADAVDGGGRG